MTTRVEVYMPGEKQYVRPWDDLPAGNMGSFSNNSDEGEREIVLFKCAEDNSKTTIYRSKKGIDIEAGDTRVVAPDPGKFTVLRELRGGQSFEMNIKSDNSPVTRKVRFTHIL